MTRAADASVTLWAGTAGCTDRHERDERLQRPAAGGERHRLEGDDGPGHDHGGAGHLEGAGRRLRLVDALNAVTSYYASNTGVTSTTSPTSGTTSTTAGVLLGDGTTRDAVQRLTSAMSTPVNGKSPSSIGIVISKDGDFDFRRGSVPEGPRRRPAGTQAILSGVATTVSAAATAASDKYTGSITTAITGKQSVVKDLNTQIDSWTDRLTMRRATLQTQ